MNDRSPRGTTGTLTTTEARRRAAGLLCIGFEGHALDARTAELLRDGAAGVVLFARNFANRAQLEELCGAVIDAAERSVIIAVDHEGGRVQRFKGTGFTELPSARSIGALTTASSGGDAAAQAANDAGTTAAQELRALGINLDFAPVLDVDSNAANPIIGDRSFSSDPEVVARLGTAFLRALQRHGVAACGKHFPGHGDTSLDSHLALPRLPHDRERLDAVELAPFVAAIDAGVAAIMTAHIVFEAIDPSVPATLSRAVIEGVLRHELGFEGVIISDDLDMKAISEHFEVGDAAVRSIEAGVDLLLCCRDPANRDRALDALAEAITSGRLTESRIDASLARIDTLATTYG